MTGGNAIRDSNPLDWALLNPVRQSGYIALELARCKSAAGRCAFEFILDFHEIGDPAGRTGEAPNAEARRLRSPIQIVPGRLQNLPLPTRVLFLEQTPNAALGQIVEAQADSQCAGDFLHRPFFEMAKFESLELSRIDLPLDSLKRGGQQVFLPLIHRTKCTKWIPDRTRPAIFTPHVDSLSRQSQRDALIHLHLDEQN